MKFIQMTINMEDFVQINSWNINLKVRLIGEGLFNMLFWMYFPFITVYFSKTLGNSLAGLLMTVPPLLSMIGSLLGGGLTDKLGRRRVMLLGAFLQTVMFILFALSKSPWMDYTAFIGIGIGGAIYRPASSAMVADLVSESQRREVFATFTTVNNIGAVLGPTLGAIFFFHYRRPLLWTCALILLLYFIAIYFIVHETCKPSEKTNEDSNVTRQLMEQFKSYGIIFRDKVFLIYILAGIFSLIPIMQLDLYLPVYVINHVPAQRLFDWKGVSIFLSSTQIFGCLVGFNGLLFVLFILPITRWLRNWKDRNVFILSSLLAGFGTFFVGLNTNIWYLFFVTIVFTLGEMVRSPVTQSFISAYAPPQARGQYMGADSLQNTIGKFLAPLMVFLSNWVPPIGVFSFILLFALISIGLYNHLFKLYVKQPGILE